MAVTIQKVGDMYYVNTKPIFKFNAAFHIKSTELGLGNIFNTEEMRTLKEFIKRENEFQKSDRGIKE